MANFITNKVNVSGLLPLNKDLVCPYCFNKFPERQIKFRCSGRPGRDNKTCKAEVDPSLRQYYGDSRTVYPAFDGDGRKTSADCPGCGCSTNYRICPTCRIVLPSAFGKEHSKLIAMVGARNSGKTVYMTVLVHELINSVGQMLDAAVDGADDETRSRFGTEYERKIYEEGVLLPQTKTASTSINRRPLLFNLTRRQNRIARGSARVNTLLSFFDTAGEDLQSQDSVDQNTRYLLGADGILLLLDPLQMTGVRDMLGAKDPNLPPRAPANDDPENVLSRITGLLRSVESNPNKRISTPIAIAFSKVDQLWAHVDDNSELRNDETFISEEKAFEAEKSLNMHHEIQALLAKWDGSKIDNKLNTDYANYRYFGVSSLGANPASGNRAPSHGVNPFRVTEPLLWLLHETKVI